MTPKMVAKFRRSLSFPNHPKHSSKPPEIFHVRSTSLPCRSHPLISQLKDCMADLKSWSSKSDNRTSGWLCDGLARLKSLHEYLDDLLQLPQTHESLRHCPRWVENLLEDFLRFVDVYGIFQTLLLALRQEHLAAQVAIRRKDDSKTLLYAKAMKKLAKEMGHLASAVRNIGTCSVPAFPDADAELGEVIGDAKEATVLVSAALFNGVSQPFVSQKSSWKGLRLPKKARKTKVEEGLEDFRLVGTENLWGLKKKRVEEVGMVL